LLATLLEDPSPSPQATLRIVVSDQVQIEPCINEDEIWWLPFAIGSNSLDLEVWAVGSRRLADFQDILVLQQLPTVFGAKQPSYHNNVTCAF
jgi:hypothetical protein